MNNATTTPFHSAPPMLRDVLLILLAMALFLFALQPREHTHGARRRDVEVSVQTDLGSGARESWKRFEAEAQASAVVESALGARH